MKKCWQGEYLRMRIVEFNTARRILWLMFWLPLLLLGLQQALKADGNTFIDVSNVTDYVRPLVGTQGGGNTYPGPSAPFGMVQLSPDTDREACGGYKYSDTSILGFSLTHLTGTGVADLGDFLFMPEVGTPKFVPGTKQDPDSG